MRIHRMIIYGASVFAALVLTAGCSMQLDSANADSSSAIKDIRALMNRNDVEKMTFMGGSVLYSPKDANANQLSSGVVVGTRIGRVDKIDLGSGQYTYRNSKTDYELGYILIDKISKESVSFTYFRFPESGSPGAIQAGNFMLNAGESADISGDGKPDIKYTKPDAGRKGVKDNMWLTFLCDMKVSDTAAMFSIVPMQYARSVYPNGLLGINSYGQYVINKYDVGTSNRAAVSAISYGDYVFDTELNTISRYVGEERNGRNARAINDGDLDALEQISSDSKPEDFEFNANEFLDEFDIKKLLSLMPQDIVTENYSSRSIADNVAYLNRLIRDPSFITKLTAANPGSVADEINAQLAVPITEDTERIIFNRHSLALFYPENCPEVNMMSSTLSSILPWFYVDFGQIADDYEEEEESDERSLTKAARKNGGKKSTSFEKEMEKYVAEATEKYKDDHGKMVEEYIEYEIKKDAIEKYFSTLKSYNFAPLFATLTNQKWLKDIVKGANGDISIGVAGGISFANANPSVQLKLGLLLKFELKNNIGVNVAATSIFAGTAPEEKDIKDVTAEFNKKFPDQNYTAEEIQDYMDIMKNTNVQKDLGFDTWYFNWDDKIQKSSSVNTIRPSKDAKSTHQAFNPIPEIPFVFTFDAQFDVLFKIQAVVQFNNVTVGGIFLSVIDCKAGIDWGFREWYTAFGKRVAPKVWTFYADTYSSSSKNTESTAFVGITTIDENKSYYGGGAKVTICPVVEFRLGAGIGYTILGAGADVSIGGGIDLFAPLTGFLGFGFTPSKDFVLTTELALDLGIGWHGDVQFCLKPPILSAKRWNYDIPGLKSEAQWQVFRIRTENFEIVKKEGFKKK